MDNFQLEKLSFRISGWHYLPAGCEDLFILDTLYSFIIMGCNASTNLRNNHKKMKNSLVLQKVEKANKTFLLNLADGIATTHNNTHFIYFRNFKLKLE